MAVRNSDGCLLFLTRLTGSGSTLFSSTRSLLFADFLPPLSSSCTCMLGVPRGLSRIFVDSKDELLLRACLSALMSESALECRLGWLGVAVGVL